MQIFQLRFVAYQEERPIQDPYLFSGFWWLEDYTWIFLSILLNFIGRPQYVLLSKSFAPTLFTPGPYIDQKATDLQHSGSFVISTIFSGVIKMWIKGKVFLCSQGNTVQNFRYSWYQ